MTTNPYRCVAERLEPVTLRHPDGSTSDRVLAFHCLRGRDHTEPHMDVDGVEWDDTDD